MILKKNKHRAVVLIFFALTLGILMSFMLLIVNTGMLVYQKIRLQTATDLASYAGASVQASYLGNEASGDASIKGINTKIMRRYFQLLGDLKGGYRAPWPVGLPDPFSCAAMCQAANVANGEHVLQLYEDALEDIEALHKEAHLIISKLPEASRRAAEETLKLNVPDLFKEDGMSKDMSEVIKNLSEQSQNSFGANDERENVALSFSSKNGAYLANIVAPVPHSFPYFGPACFSATETTGAYPAYFCIVNGQGLPGPQGMYSAALAYARSFHNDPQVNGNIGNVKGIAEEAAAGIRLGFILNPHKPAPFFVSAAEYYPKNGSYMNLENVNSFGVKNGAIFPKQTRLVAVSAAEPFGSSLSDSEVNFGARLQSIRRLVLDPRMTGVKDDYADLFSYFEVLSPKDTFGQPVWSAEEVAAKFLH